jgi:signal transduction histidine kinase
MSNAAVPADVRAFIISTLAPRPGQKRCALGFLVFLAAMTSVGVYLGRARLPRIDAVIPAFAVAMFIADLLTAFLLFAQFFVLRSRALIAISCGYLYTGLITVVWTLTFPGVTPLTERLGAGLQTTAWLYIFWHAGFPLFAIAYVFLDNEKREKLVPHGSLGIAASGSIALVVSLIGALAVLATAGQGWLPKVAIGPMFFSRMWLVPLGCSALLTVIATVLLSRRMNKSVLDLGLMVVMFSFLSQSIIAFASDERFTLTWYAERAIALVAANLVLAVMLYETTTLYTQLVRALLARRLERDARLMTGDAISASIAHDVRQPLTGILANADAALRFLKRRNPDLDEVEDALRCILNDGQRAGTVVENIRASFKSGAQQRKPLDVEKLVKDSLELSSAALQAHRISLDVTLEGGLPPVIGDEIQLQRVFLNLIINAADAMALIRYRERVLRVSCGLVSGKVRISVEDSGPGVEPEHIERIFDPLFTTKPAGTGLGLAICRSIVEAHQGRLVAAPNRSRGALFLIYLPAGAAC